MNRTNLYSVVAFAALSLPLMITACSDDDGTSSAAGGSSSSGSSTGGGASVQELSGNITDDMTLTADTQWLLKGIVRVESGATLTIEPGTTVFGDKASSGTLVIKQGAKIEAAGTANEPIVFTSQLPEGERAAGDWGGVIVLGNAPINEPGGTSSIEGLNQDEFFGGTDPADSSGTLQYIRIEFSGIEIAPDNEINGLTFGGVGSGTTVDHVQVRHTLDDCFEFFGGTVNASHLICYRNGDDGFDFDDGYVGNLQFLFLQQDPTVADSANGFEADNDKDAPDAVPVTNPTISNVTLCGQNADLPKQQYGLLFRRGFNATISNAIVTGFEAAVDLRDTPFTNVTLSSTIFFGNNPENIAYAEDGSNDAEQNDDDNGTDEVMWFNDGTDNSVMDPALADCFNATPDAAPESAIVGETPADNGFFDTSANYIGAFKDSSDNWATGAWVSWTQN